MIILFPIDRFDRDKFKAMSDDQIVTLSHILNGEKETIFTYPTTEDFLTDIDDQAIDPNAYWHIEVNKKYVVSFITHGQHETRVICNTPEEARLLSHHLQNDKDLKVVECFDGAPFTTGGPAITVHSIKDYLDKTVYPDFKYKEGRPIYVRSDIFSVTFTYTTPMTGKTRYVVECDSNDEAMRIANDAHSIDGTTFVRTYPCRRPVGKNGVRMTAEDYWKMYGNK